MKLFAYKIEGVPFTNLDTYLDGDLEGYDALTVGTSATSAYEDISSIENWEKWGPDTGKDFKFYRREIKLLYEETTWEALTTEEKKVLSRMFIVEKTKRDEVYTTEEQMYYSRIFHKNSTESRQVRYSLVASMLFNNLSKTDCFSVMDDIEENHLMVNYIHYGLEGVDKGDPEGIYDYINSTTGTSYASAGFNEKNITPVCGSKQCMIDRAMQILEEGLY